MPRAFAALPFCFISVHQTTGSNVCTNMYLVHNHRWYIFKYSLDYTHNAAIPKMYLVHLLSAGRRSKYSAIAATDNRHTTSVPDPWRFDTDPPNPYSRLDPVLYSDPDPAAFSSFQDSNKNKLFSYFLLKVHLHQFPKIKRHSEVTEQYKSRLFSIFFAWKNKGSDPDTHPDSY